MYLRTVKIQQYFWFKLFFFFSNEFQLFILSYVDSRFRHAKQAKQKLLIFIFKPYNFVSGSCRMGWSYLIISLLFWGFIFLIYSQFICHIEIYPLSRWSALTLAISILMLFRCTARCCLLRLSVAAICTFIFS